MPGTPGAEPAGSTRARGCLMLLILLKVRQLVNIRNLGKIKEKLAADDRVAAIFLFGSFARGQAGPLSDVDIAVFLSPQVDSGDYLNIRLEMMGEAAALLESDDIDLLILNEASPALADHVARYGTRLLVKDEASLPAFLERSLVLYLDFEPYAKAYDGELTERIRKGAFGA